MISAFTSMKNARILKSSHAKKQIVMIEKYNDDLISILTCSGLIFNWSVIF